VRTLEVSLVEWPDGPEHGGPRLLGRSADPELVEAVRRGIAATRRLELARIEGVPCVASTTQPDQT